MSAAAAAAVRVFLCSGIAFASIFTFFVFRASFLLSLRFFFALCCFCFGLFHLSFSLAVLCCFCIRCLSFWLSGFLLCFRYALFSVRCFFSLISLCSSLCFVFGSTSDSLMFFSWPFLLFVSRFRYEYALALLWLSACFFTLLFFSLLSLSLMYVCLSLVLVHAALLLSL